MIWLTWRHYRWMLALGILALVVLIPLFVLDANTLKAAFQEHHFEHCYEGGYIPCGLMPISGNTAQWRTIAEFVLPLFPFFVGVFLGAPLLPREYEQRTHLFSWTQSLSPTRWFSLKLLIIGGATLFGFGLLSSITTWWGFIQDEIAFSPWSTFMIRGSVPVANALFCLMVGVMIGSFIRRTLPAMALTLVVLFFVQSMISMGYSHLLPPSSQLDYYQKIRQQHLIGRFANNPQDLIVAVKYVGPDGNFVENVRCLGLTGPYVMAGGSVREILEVKECLDTYHVTPLVEYQRFDERFWPLQLVTTALLLGLMVGVTSLTYWQLGRRRL